VATDLTHAALMAWIDGDDVPARGGTEELNHPIFRSDQHVTAISAPWFQAECVLLNRILRFRSVIGDTL
jgi:hypothetical protein